MTKYQIIIAFLFWIFQGKLGLYAYLLTIDEVKL